jgi:hypothetical protein
VTSRIYPDSRSQYTIYNVLIMYIERTKDASQRNKAIRGRDYTGYRKQ